MIDTKAFFKLTYGLYVVGVKADDTFAGCLVDAVMQTTTKPASLVLCCNQGTLTREYVEKTKEFTLSVVDENVDAFVLGNFGFQSCRAVNKWENVPFHLMGDLPVLDDAAAYLRCKVTETKQLSTHTLFFCDIVEAINGNKKALSYTQYQESWKAKTLEAFKAGKMSQISNVGDEKMTVKYVCDVCGYEYDGETPFEELGDDYECPLCSVGKDQFSKVEE